MYFCSIPCQRHNRNCEFASQAFELSVVHHYKVQKRSEMRDNTSSVENKWEKCFKLKHEKVTEFVKQLSCCSMIKSEIDK